MIKFIVNAALVFGLLYLLKEMFSSKPAKTAKSKPKPEPDAELLVEDPQCGVFVPLSLAVKGPGDTHFCSSECLDAYKRAHG